MSETWLHRLFDSKRKNPWRGVAARVALIRGFSWRKPQPPCRPASHGHRVQIDGHAVLFGGSGLPQLRQDLWLIIFTHTEENLQIPILAPGPPGLFYLSKS
jgi:hypothetical protein